MGIGEEGSCWRRRNINLPACERGQWNTESSEFIMCLKPSCKPQGQSCENSGDCCDDNVCKSLVGGKGKVCVAPPLPPCVWLLVRVALLRALVVQSSSAVEG